MKLSELGAQTTVRLEITIEGRQFEFDTVVQLQHKHDMLFEPIRKDGKLLNVQGENVTVDIIYVRKDEKPVRWHNVDMLCIRYRHKVYYCVNAETDGAEYNRRSDYRLFIGEEIHAKIGHGGPDRIVLLKDLSNSGFAFIYPEDLEDEDNIFVYMVYPASVNEKAHELSLYGKVVRKMPLGDGRTLYGCALLKKNELIGHFINQKQMEQLAKKNMRMRDAKSKKKAM